MKTEIELEGRLEGFKLAKRLIEEPYDDKDSPSCELGTKEKETLLIIGAIISELNYILDQ